jgi:hypothetical protein
MGNKLTPPQGSESSLSVLFDLPDVTVAAEAFDGGEPVVDVVALKVVAVAVLNRVDIDVVVIVGVVVGPVTVVAGGEGSTVTMSVLVGVAGSVSDAGMGRVLEAAGRGDANDPCISSIVKKGEKATYDAVPFP